MALGGARGGGACHSVAAGAPTFCSTFLERAAAAACVEAQAMRCIILGDPHAWVACCAACDMARGLKYGGRQGDGE